MLTARRLSRLVWLLGAVPALAMGVGLARDALGANPVEALTHATGGWALRFLLASLAITPLRRFSGLAVIAPLRRTFGLLAFCYASLHFSIYLGLDLGFDPGLLIEDVLERPFVTVGFGAWMLLLPLAISSTRGWQRRLGRRWLLLHRLVYVALGCVLVHFLWGAKADLREPLVYAAVGAFLLALRATRRRPGPASAVPGT
jgi:sulfoxide reductase heme-binding subunit YedZ